MFNLVVCKVDEKGKSEGDGEKDGYGGRVDEEDAGLAIYLRSDYYRHFFGYLIFS